MSEVLVLGGDGFCGWPTALHLADNGNHVTIVDNLSRRRIDQELGSTSLTPILPIDERLKAWEEVAGQEKAIDFVNIDIAEDYELLENLLVDLKPDAVVHFAEQRSAPYSMKNSETKRYTIANNTLATGNLLTALVHSGVKSPLVHLGTMGVYGYGWAGSAPIPEGYIDVTIHTPEGDLEKEILYPSNAGSVYHNTKVTDQAWFAFFAKNDGLQITDLHQGIVWGTQTPQSSRDERLINRFDYDGDYGTVLNRFLMQAAIDYPLTVYGTGGQTRAFINIKDTVRCVELAIANPPQVGEKPKIFNQVTEVYKVRDLAKMVAEKSGVKVEFLENPRKEAEENELVVDHNKFLDLGLNPTTLNDGLLEEITEIAKKYAARADRSVIPPSSKWVS